MEYYKCYFDGSCEPHNPGGNMGCGIYIEGEGNIFTDSIHIPAKKNNTNNVAEYMAFIRVLEIMKYRQGCNINIYGDSMLVIKQMNKAWRLKSGAYLEYALKAKSLFEALKLKNAVTLSWIKRELNEKADELSKIKP